MSRLLVIGNGFDLSFGLKTSYSHFVESSQFQQLLSNKSLLASRIQESKIKNNWVDLETELINYANQKKWSTDLMINDFINEFRDLKIQLLSFLNTALDELPLASLPYILKSEPKQIAGAFKIFRFGRSVISKNNESDWIESIPNETYSLNYTNTLERVGWRPSLTGGGLYTNLHGTLHEDNIIFGVNDGSVGVDFSFLLKSAHPNYKSGALLEKIKKYQEIDFFGCSFGSTDDDQFAPVFRHLLIDGINMKSLMFCIESEFHYQQLIKRLVGLTNNRLALLRRHELLFYDSSRNKLML